MILCSTCGYENEGSDEFCGSCGAFLEWSGERVAEPEPEQAPEPEHVPEDRPGLVERVKAAVGGEGASARRTSPDPVPAPAPQPTSGADEVAPPAERALVAVEAVQARTESEEASTREAEARAAAEAASSARSQAEARAEDSSGAREEVDQADAEEMRRLAKAEDEARQLEARAAEAKREAEARLRALVAQAPPPPPPAPAPEPTSSPATRPPGAFRPEARQPAARQPGARLPAPSRARPVAKRQPSRQLRPGELICGQCGEGNDPARKFCRRCGASLVDAVVVQVPWWKRILPRRKAAAGDRPMRKGGSRQTGARRVRRAVGRGARIAAVLTVLGLGLGVAGPWRGSVTARLGDGYQWAKELFFPSLEQVHPVAAEATSALDAHPAELAIDGANNRAWTEGAEGDGVGEQVVLTLAEPVDLAKIGFLPGASSKPEEFLAQPRPKDLHMVFSDGSATDVRLEDSAEFQAFDVDAKAVTQVTVQIVSVYPSFKGGHDCSISEIELRARA